MAATAARSFGRELACVLERQSLAVLHQEAADIGKGETRQLGEHAIGGDAKPLAPLLLRLLHRRGDLGLAQEARGDVARPLFLIAGAAGGTITVQIDEVLVDKALLPRVHAREASSPAKEWERKRPGGQLSPRAFSNVRVLYQSDPDLSSAERAVQGWRYRC